MATPEDITRAIETATKQAEDEAARQARRDADEPAPADDARRIVDQIRHAL